MGAAGIQVQLNEEASRQQQYGEQESALFNQQAASSAKLSDEASAVAEAARISTTELGTLQLNNEIALRAGADVLGGNIQNKAAEQISGLASEQEETRGQMKMALGEYRKNVDASFFDDPIRWIHANVFGGTEQSATSYNAVATQYNESKARLATVLAQTSQQAANQRALQFTTTDAAISADARVKAFQYLEAAARADYNKLGSDIGGVRALATGGANALNMRVKAFDEARAAEDQSMRKQQFDEYMKEAGEKDSARSLMDNVIKAGFASYKLAIPDEASTSSIRLAMNTPEGKAKFQHIFDAGMYKVFQTDPASAPVSFGQDAYSAIKGIMTINSRLENDPTVGEYKPRIQYLKDVYATTSNNKLLDEKKRPDEFHAAYLDTIKRDATNWGQNAEAGKQTMDSPGFAAILQGNPQLAKSAFVTQIIGPMQTSGQVTMPAEQIMRATAQAMKEKKLTVEEAANGVSEYFGTALAWNNKANFAFALPYQTQYKARVGLGGSTVLNRYENAAEALLRLQRRSDVGDRLDDDLRTGGQY